MNYKFIKRSFEGKTTLTYDSRQLTEEDLKKEMALLPDASLSYPEEFRPTPRNEDLGTTDQWIEQPYYEQDVLDEIRAALTRIDEGTFGMCHSCKEDGRPPSKCWIPKVRLKYIPYARNCVECERHKEGSFARR